MSGLATRHLNDDEFAEAMMEGALDAEARAHVYGCEHCQREMERFESSVQDFSLAALRWSESQPAYRSTRAGRAGGQRWTSWVIPPAAWALAAAVLLGVVVPVTVHFEHGRYPIETAQSTPAEFASSDSPEQIARDNALMAAVNDELSKSEAAMLAAHGRTGTRERRR